MKNANYSFASSETYNFRWVSDRRQRTTTARRPCGKRMSGVYRVSDASDGCKIKRGLAPLRSKKV